MRDLMRFGVVVVIFLIGEVLGKEVGGAKAYPVFPIGPTGIHASIEPGFKVVVRSIDKGSPSDKSSLQAGDFIYRAEGVAVEGPDPRVTLGKAISLAEASDGVLDFRIVRAKDPSSLEKGVSISLEKIGAYRNSWPANCEKSEAVILKGARHVFSALKKDGSYQLGRERLGFNDLKACMASLFLLSTGDDAYLPAIGNHARILAKSAESRRNAGGHINWQLGYQGIFLSEWLKLTTEKQKLEQERIAADRTLVAASQDTLKKREASDRDLQNIENKNLLIVAEQIEDLARQIVQRYAEKLANLNKLIVAHKVSIDNLNAEIPQLNARTEQLTTEHQQLITQRAQAAKDKGAKLAKIKAANTEILMIEKQLEVLNKTVQDQEKISAAAKEVIIKAMVKRSQFAERLKKWKAASINTSLIQARSELAALASLNQDDPSTAPKFIAQQKKYDDLSLRYQAAKQ
ncbi:DUF6288 domain-containing protein [Akkermansiaceae bacterium]|nr:DUF6288 domain-containing protein [Akkermansiaceae bacterium]